MAITTNEVPPVRLVSRLASELSLINLRASLRFTPNRFETSMMAKALLRGALPYLVSDGNLVLPTCQPIIGSISAIARSFGRPVETVRRHVHVLVRQGMFTVEPDGVRLSPNQASGERIVACCKTCTTACSG